MSSRRRHVAVLLIGVVFALACASAEDRLEEGVVLQAQGRYMEAVYRYAEAVEKDGSLREARERLLAAGDSAVEEALRDAERLVERSDPVGAASRYRDIDRMLRRIREAGTRLEPPATYEEDRRALFDRAIAWRMSLGDEARREGRWTDARRAYADARAAFSPSRRQVEASLEAETELLLEWAEVELDDERPRAAYLVAAEAAEVRSSTPRDVVLSVRDLQGRALERGSIVVAVPPVVAREPVRHRLGPEFEIDLDERLALDHWTEPPPFVRMADHTAMRGELRSLLRGVPQTPLLVGRALELVGGDLAAMIEVSDVEVVEEDVQRITREARLTDGAGQRAPRSVEYTVVEGTLVYRASADVILVDHAGREVTRLRAEGHSSGAFRRGAFDGNPDRLELSDDERALFDPRTLAEQAEPIEAALMADLAMAIAAGTYDTVVERIP
ncbi:MAG: hypothetical protein U5R14_02620 [Gemmatimonadota bacterium]|nr:hypothetical protein [Gemmatimonadota bacterium]